MLQARAIKIAQDSSLPNRIRCAVHIIPPTQLRHSSSRPMNFERAHSSPADQPMRPQRNSTGSSQPNWPLIRLRRIGQRNCCCCCCFSCFCFLLLVGREQRGPNWRPSGCSGQFWPLQGDRSAKMILRRSSLVSKFSANGERQTRFAHWLTRQVARANRRQLARS